MEKWQQGDSAAFEEFFREHEKPVLRTAYLITGSKQQAEDIMQSVFLSAWKFRSSYDPAKGKPSTWLHRIVVNQCSNAMKKPGLKPSSLDDCEQVEDMEPKPEEALLARDERRRLTEAISAMPEKYRAILVLHYFNDLTCRDIAVLLKLPVGTVQWRLNQALKIARNKLREYADISKRGGKDEM
jgi:RNA polymerase sigma factor (sigma-70 family)